MTLQLFATPLSHFSRKVRLLLDHYEIEYRLIDVGNVAGADLERFNGNPLMKVPVLVDDGLWLIESDHIAAHLVRKHDPRDRYRVLTTEPAALNARAMLNGMMSEEVKLILAERTGLRTEPHAFFHKARASIENGLRWLDDEAALFDVPDPGYLEFHLICFWDHLQHYAMLPLEYPRLAAIAAQLNTRERITRSAPRR